MHTYTYIHKHIEKQVSKLIVTMERDRESRCCVYMYLHMCIYGPQYTTKTCCQHSDLGHHGVQLSSGSWICRSRASGCRQPVAMSRLVLLFSPGIGVPNVLPEHPSTSIMRP